MDATDKQLREKLAAFESRKDPDLLQEAFNSIEKAGQNASDDAARARQLERWLSFLATVDRNIDPKWDANDVPVTGVIPKSSGGVAHFPNVDPAEIKDPKARAEYEKELKTNKDAAERYRVQHELRRAEERVIAAIEGLAGNKSSIQSLTELIDSAQLSETRKAQLRAVISKSR